MHIMQLSSFPIGGWPDYCIFILVIIIQLDTRDPLHRPNLDAIYAAA